jgi:hypothetical protein
MQQKILFVLGTMTHTLQYCAEQYCVEKKEHQSSSRLYAAVVTDGQQKSKESPKPVRRTRQLLVLNKTTSVNRHQTFSAKDTSGE